MPISYVLGVRGQTLWGLWAGYGASAFTLAIVYYTILHTLNWKEVAKFASIDEIALTQKS